MLAVINKRHIPQIVPIMLTYVVFIGMCVCL